jgi:hypothetical protein
MNSDFAGVLIFLFGVILGWIFAHSEVATECQRQGTFYVGSNDFKCEVIKK